MLGSGVVPYISSSSYCNPWVLFVHAQDERERSSYSTPYSPQCPTPCSFDGCECTCTSVPSVYACVYLCLSVCVPVCRQLSVSVPVCVYLCLSLYVNFYVFLFMSRFRAYNCFLSLSLSLSLSLTRLSLCLCICLCVYFHHVISCKRTHHQCKLCKNTPLIFLSTTLLLSGIPTRLHPNPHRLRSAFAYKYSPSLALLFALHHQ
jgi:hypothetical protein